MSRVRSAAIISCWTCQKHPIPKYTSSLLSLFSVVAARARLGVVVARIPLPKIADDRNVRRDDGGRTTTNEDDDEEADKLLDECCGRTVAWANTESGDDARKSRMFIMFIFRAGMRRRERTENSAAAAAISNKTQRLH